MGSAHLHSASLHVGREQELYDKTMRTASRFHFVAARSRTFPPEDFLLTFRSIHLASDKENGRKRSSCASTSLHFLPFSLQFSLFSRKIKSTRRDSNPRPSPWQGDAPPLSHSCISFLRIFEVVAFGNVPSKPHIELHLIFFTVSSSHFRPSG